MRLPVPIHAVYIYADLLHVLDTIMLSSVNCVLQTSHNNIITLSLAAQK